MNPSRASPMPKVFENGESTPIVYSKNNLKSLSRKLWGKKSVAQRVDHSECSDEHKWDKIKAPKFSDFFNIPDDVDSFFDNVNVIASTPNSVYKKDKVRNFVNVEELEDEDTLVASFSSVNLSEIKQEQREKLHEVRAEDTKVKEEYGENVVNKDVNQPKQKEEKKEEIIKLKKLILTEVKPFTFELRDKQRQKQKQERINKILEEEKKMKVFRAQPLPKFLKTQALYTNKDTSNTNNDDHNKNNGKTRDKIKKTDPQKAPAKCTEVWKKPPFMPCLLKENVTRAKTPPLRTTVRSQQRKHFDDSVKENQRQKEKAMQREMAVKKKQEEEEIARLRKQTVHKAQPIRKYKFIPVIEKRPLTDPMTPLSFKRRRHA